LFCLLKCEFTVKMLNVPYYKWTRQFTTFLVKQSTVDLDNKLHLLVSTINVTYSTPAPTEVQAILLPQSKVLLHDTEVNRLVIIILGKNHAHCIQWLPPSIFIFKLITPWEHNCSPSLLTWNSKWNSNVLYT
jgi:hypothetical protein